MFENLSDRLERSFKILKGEGKITEINVAETLKDVRRALLDADVNYKVAKSFTDTVKQKALGMNVLTAVKPGQLMVKIVHDELAELMGGEAVGLNLSGRPSIILMSGLQGSGKTTFSGKLANMLKTKEHKNPLLVACDVYRPAAIDQLKVVGEQVGVAVYSEPENKNVNEIADHALAEAKAKGNDVVIIDTAGRLAVDEEMMNEIESLKNHVHPDETLFVVDSMTGQDAVNTAKEFNDRLDFNGVVLTKLDGDTRGGAALSIRTVVTKPIKFIGTGEKMEAIDVFHPGRMADRILGMGDVVSLVERAQEQFDEEEAKRLQKKIQKNQFDFNDFYNQIQQIKKMGNLKDLASMIPGVGKAIRDVDIDDNAFKGIEAIIQSMTPKERTNPELLNNSRRQRIAKGSGTNIQEVNRLIKQFDQTRKMMKMVTNIITMEYQLIDGKATATAIKQDIAEEVKAIVAAGGKQPHLAAVLVGHDGGSETYVKNKVIACEQCGFKSTLIRFEADVTEEELLACVDKLNKDEDVDGFIVQLPLPKHIDEQKIIMAVDYRKDVDGFHPINVGRMAIGLPCFISATPLGILTLLQHYHIETSGKKCVILGRSNIVGKPMAQLMMQKQYGDSTVTVCHSRSKDLKKECQEADIIIAAIGRPEFVTADMVKPGAVVIDVGTTRVEDKTRKSGFRLCGDVKFDEVAPLCSFITPVPGGVGPMTICSLMKNTLAAGKKEYYK